MVQIRTSRWLTRKAALFLAIAIFLLLLFLSIPFFLTWEQNYELSTVPKYFPVTVDPATKTITEDPKVEALLAAPSSALTATVLNAGMVLSEIAAAINDSPLYEALAATDARAAVIQPGYRKEQVAAAFDKALSWDPKVEKAFLASTSNSEGKLSPGTYVLGFGSLDLSAQKALSDRFNTEILSRYSSAVAAKVPLDEALTIASMVERETNDKNEMRMISGIIWNRIFAGMKLQIDPTLQYAKANGKNGWWPMVTAKDKYIQSPYNTYQNVGLPPGPISNPSVFAVLATLNPKKTDCLFYFHDRAGDFHCSATYAVHVALLKQYYGRGK